MKLPPTLVCMPVPGSFVSTSLVDLGACMLGPTPGLRPAHHRAWEPGSPASWGDASRRSATPPFVQVGRGATLGSRLAGAASSGDLAGGGGGVLWGGSAMGAGAAERAPARPNEQDEGGDLLGAHRGWQMASQPTNRNKEADQLMKPTSNKRLTDNTNKPSEQANKLTFHPGPLSMGPVEGVEFTPTSHLPPQHTVPVIAAVTAAVAIPVAVAVAVTAVAVAVAVATVAVVAVAAVAVVSVAVAAVAVVVSVAVAAVAVVAAVASAAVAVVVSVAVAAVAVVVSVA
eukprot:365007-Chlamydomonas_euryale.AAC.4